jgi:transposase-like protein
VKSTCRRAPSRGWCLASSNNFARWSKRDLSEERYAILYLDGFYLKVRLARRVVSAPVLAVLGVAEDGSKVLVSLRLAVSEAGVHWRAMIEDLKARGLATPRVIVSDGHKGLAKKAREAWPEAKVLMASPRCSAVRSTSGRT